MAGTSEGARKGHKTRLANAEKFRNRSAGQRKRRERERAERDRIGGGGRGPPKRRFQRYRELTLSDELNEYLSASYRDIQKTRLRDVSALYEIYDHISDELENIFDMMSGGVMERWDNNYQNPTGQRRTFEFELWRDDRIAYKILYFGGVMHSYEMPEDFNLNSLLNLIKSVGVWE